MKNKKLKELKKFLNEDNITPNLQTVAPVNSAGTLQPQNISLDAKVDHYLISFEKESSPIAQNNNSTVYESSSTGRRLGEFLFSRFLFEADDTLPGNDESTDSAGGPSDDVGGSDPFSGGDNPFGGDDTGGEDSEKTEAPPEVPVPKINLKILAPKLARLVTNYEQLLDPKTVMLNRIQAFFQKNYSETIAKELMTTLDLSYGLKPNNPNSDDYGQNEVGMGAGVGDLTANPSTGGEA